MQWSSHDNHVSLATLAIKNANPDPMDLLSPLTQLTFLFLRICEVECCVCLCNKNGCHRILTPLTSLRWLFCGLPCILRYAWLITNYFIPAACRHLSACQLFIPAACQLEFFPGWLPVLLLTACASACYVCLSTSCGYCILSTWSLVTAVFSSRAF